MILKETLRQIVIGQRAELESFEYGIEREEIGKIELDLPYAIIISGIRRSGKSTLLHQLIKKLSNFYFLNFEDIRLIDFESSDFEKLDEIFQEEYGVSQFYLLDEIQNVEHWEIFVRSRLDKRKQFIITGSNASLLSAELGTRLTGRHLNFELFPFSFREILQWKNETANPKTFEMYLIKGGFPEFLKYEKVEILRELLSDILHRDIVSRYKVREVKALQEMAIYLLSNVGKEFSFNSLKRMFEFGSVNTPISFVSHMENSFLLFTIPKFDYSLRKQLINEKKVYSIDNGLSVANTVSFSSDKGRMLENSVFLELRRFHKEIYYFKGKGECDFLVKKEGMIRIAIQVTYELNEDNKRRELDGLLEAMSRFALKEGLIITFNQEDEIVLKGNRISVKPAWKWMQRPYED